MGGVDPNRPLNLRDPNGEGGAIRGDSFTHENGSAYNGGQPQSGQPGQSMGITPPVALPQIGQTTASESSMHRESLASASGEASANNAHIQATTDATIKAIDGLIALNDKTPDSTGLPPEYKAALDKRAPGLSKYLGMGGDAGALAQWEQLSSQGVLGGIKQLGLGRLDIPIVKQIQESNGIPADLPRSQRIALLNQLKTAIINNRSVAQNTAANLNQPGVGNVQGQAPISGYNVRGVRGCKISLMNCADVDWSSNGRSQPDSYGSAFGHAAATAGAIRCPSAAATGPAISFGRHDTCNSGGHGQGWLPESSDFLGIYPNFLTGGPMP